MTKSKIYNYICSIKRIIQSKKVEQSKIMQNLTNNDDISKIIGEIGNRSKVVEKNNEDSYLRKSSYSFKQQSDQNQIDSKQLINNPQASASSKTTNLSGADLTKSKSTVTRSETDSKFKEDSDINVTTQNLNSAANFTKENKETIIAGAKLADKNKEVIAQTGRTVTNEVKSNPILSGGAKQAKKTNDPLKSLFGISAPKDS